MPFIYFVGQGCSILAWLLLITSYHTKRENRVIFFQILSSILYLVNYICLGAFTGFWISLFELIKSVGYYKTDKDKYIYFGSIPVYLIIIYFMGFDILTLFAVIGSLIDGFVMLKDKKTMVIGGMISYSLWIVYDLCFFDFAGATSDFFVVVSNALILIKGYGKYLRRGCVYTLRSMNVSKNTLKIIDKLDNDNYDKEFRWNLDTITELTKDQKYSYILVKDENKIIGYINFLNLKEETYNKMLESNELYDNFTKDDLADVTRNRKLYMNLNSIVISDEYNNSNTIKKVEDAIERYINNMRKDKYYIQEVCSFAVNPFENKILNEISFNKIKDITNECMLYRKVISTNEC